MSDHGSVEKIVATATVFFVMLSGVSLALCVISLLLLRPVLFVLFLLGFLSSGFIASVAGLIWVFVWFFIKPKPPTTS